MKPTIYFHILSGQLCFKIYWDHFEYFTLPKGWRLKYIFTTCLSHVISAYSYCGTVKKKTYSDSCLTSEQLTNKKIKQNTTKKDKQRSVQPNSSRASVHWSMQTNYLIEEDNLQLKCIWTLHSCILSFFTGRFCFTQKSNTKRKTHP